MEINFSNIRTHDGSKNSGFEELVCQLAHLQQPDNGKTFVRKEGAGGDAGVECYWVLDDDSEIGWQVKYFPDGLNSSRWQQIDESFSTALEKHHNLNHYVVCLPRNEKILLNCMNGEQYLCYKANPRHPYFRDWSRLISN